MQAFEQILTQRLMGNTFRAYITAILIVVLGFLLSRAFRWLLKKSFGRIGKLTKNDVDDLLLSQAVGPLSGIVFLLFCYAGGLLLSMPERFRDTYNNTLFVIGAILIGSFAVNAVDITFRKALQPWAIRSGFDDQIATFLRKFLKIIVALLLTATTLDHIGFDVVSLVTGLGIGGLAVAFAAQQTLGNVLGSIQILSDRPFSVGDWIRAEGHWGEVVEIGLRSTKIMTRGKIMVVIPNSKLAEASIENVSVGKNLAVNLEIGLVYGTSASQMQHAVEILKHILEEQDGVLNEKLVHFLAFDSSSLTIKCTYFVTHIRKFWDVQHIVNLKIKEEFDKAELDFAFPTQTLHLASMPTGLKLS